MRVLLDGEYRRQTTGSGLTTYSRTLAAGLNALGHEVAWLSGAHAARRSDPLADAASVADDPIAARGLRQQLETLRAMAGGLIAAGARPRRVTAQQTLLPAPVEPIFLEPDLFVHAHYRHMLLRQFTDVKRPDGVDVMHLTAPLPLSMRGVRRVVTIHDLAPIRIPSATPDNKAEFVHRVRQCAREADLVLTVSNASKNDIVSLLGLDPGKVAVTYQPGSLSPIPAESLPDLPQRLARFGLEPGGYALFVGAQEPKKNLRRLIEAFLDADAGLPLVIVGGRAWMWDREVGAALAALGEAQRARIRMPGYVAAADLPWLYAGARAFLFPSLLEGFGLPALDALACGVPTLVSGGGALEEICGEAALTVDAFERESIREGIERILGDSSLRQRLTAAGPRRASAFSFAAYVSKLGEAYSRLQR